ncbi:TOBE domain-containing protein [Rhodococcus erythropolis]|uniref:TOBE domain-containing protein n=1 Tax=Rhodococcus erythropolis TaxID=1833 RepID=UPI00210BD316|nr:TOBE domain-containing protein [Rhodococcus erythropolis]MCQ4126292.1 TOBE domain-containing protein [Rhodococcus erythropolis]
MVEVHPPQSTGVSETRLSTRNQLTGTITEVNLGTVMATVKVKLDGGNQIVTSSITRDAALDLDLEPGQAATVFVKSTEVTIGVE